MGNENFAFIEKFLGIFGNLLKSRDLFIFKLYNGFVNTSRGGAVGSSLGS